MAVGQVSGCSGTGMGVFTKNCAFLLSFLTAFSPKLGKGQVQKFNQTSLYITNTMGNLGLKFQPHRKFLDSTYWLKNPENGLVGAPNGTGLAHFSPILTHLSLKTLNLVSIGHYSSLPTQKSRSATWPPAFWLKNASFGLLGWNGTLNAAIFNVFTASDFFTPIGFWGGAESKSEIRFSSRDQFGGHFSSFSRVLKNTQNGVFSAFPAFFHRVVAQSVGTSLVQLSHMPPSLMPPYFTSKEVRCTRLRPQPEGDSHGTSRVGLPCPATSRRRLESARTAFLSGVQPSTVR
jgi:hypothetical protein